MDSGVGGLLCRRRARRVRLEFRVKQHGHVIRAEQDHLVRVVWVRDSKTHPAGLKSEPLSVQEETPLVTRKNMDAALDMNG
jgi:hypothetical protein